MLKTVLFSIAISFGISVWSQKITVDTCWHLPIGINEPEMSAGFGDIRPNHFHMGLDFRTNGPEGIPLHAISDGYISRIRISPTGYGRVIYINHANGITSVYAHCSAFSKRIQSFINPVQEQLKQNDFDWHPNPNEIPVKRGEQIALSGNSGNSTGPHLHFELRDTKTEHALNPLLHGFHVSDVAAPLLQGIRLVGIDENGYLIPGKSVQVPLAKSSHTIKIPVDFVRKGERVGVCLAASDPLKTGGSTYGLFSAELWIPSGERFGFELSEISFDDSRYVNSHMDYDEYKASGVKFQKLFRTKQNPLTIYQLQSIGGIILNGYDSISCSLILADVKGNTAQHELTLKYQYPIRQENKSFFDHKTHFIPDSSYRLYATNMNVFVEESTFYEPVKKSLKLASGQFGTSKSVIQKAICVELKGQTSIAIEKQYLAVNGDALVTTRENGWLSAESKQLGTFTSNVDTLAPVIQFLPTSSNNVVPSQLSWKITDGQAGIERYDLFINGEWTIIYYDQKNDVVIWKNDRRATIIGPASKDVLSMELRITDRCGNVQTWRKELHVIDEHH
jgi:murein DD-endopeptidase MepM/ murein hydrolase activator NlpD